MKIPFASDRKRKDEEFYQVLFEMFRDHVYQAAYFMTQDRYLAQDVLQETFIRAFEKIHTLKDKRKAGAWLAAIATNVAIDLLRNRKKWNGIPVEYEILENAINLHETANAVESEVEKRLIKAYLNKRLEALKPEFQQLILLKYVHGLKDEEIATMLEIKVGTVKSRIHRAKAILLQDILRNEGMEIPYEA